MLGIQELIIFAVKGGGGVFGWSELLESLYGIYLKLAGFLALRHLHFVLSTGTVCSSVVLKTRLQWIGNQTDYRCQWSDSGCHATAVMVAANHSGCCALLTPFCRWQ